MTPGPGSSFLLLPLATVCPVASGSMAVCAPFYPGSVAPLFVAVAGLLVIAACNQLAPKVGVASPLILLALGVGVGFLPWVAAVEVEPEIILEMVLPPLLFAAAVSMPVMDFRRELQTVAGLAIGLVVVSALVLGVVIHLLVPAIALPWAIALGAVLSPTDAVAVSIARGSGVSHRIITILEGEGLFNDATALVLLSSAVSAGLMTNEDALEPLTLAGEFLLALAVALVVGWSVGVVAVRVRSRISDSAADTAVSFTVPFLASVPAEHLGGSGLVAAVVAGLVVSYRGPRLLPPSNRRTAQKNWRTVELILEGGVFLVMGLQAYGIVHELTDDPAGAGLGLALLVAVVCGALTVVVRAAFVTPLLAWLAELRRRSVRRVDLGEERIAQFEERLAHACDADEEMLAARNLSTEEWQRALERWRRRLERGRRRQKRARSDLAYFLSQSLGPREGAVIVWAGMRGAVTLAAAQTLPLEAPMRSFMLLVALVVAAGSLVIQGLTLTPFIQLVKPQMASHGADEEERARLMRLLGHAVKDTALAQFIAGQPGELSQAQDPSSAQQAGRAGGTMFSLPSVGKAMYAGQLQAGGEAASESGTLAARQALGALPREKMRALAKEAIHAQRDALLDARDDGVFSSQTLEAALMRLDAEEVLLDATH